MVMGLFLLQGAELPGPGIHVYYACMLVSECTCSRVRDYLGTHLMATGEFSGMSDSCNLAAVT